jgi:CubicO group peptidase (beta-lactamase class C family)
MARLILSTLLALASVQANSSTTPKDPPPGYDLPEAYEVYSAILPSEWSWKDAKAKWLVIRQATTAYEMCLSPDAASQQLIGPAIADYVQQNKQPWLLQRKFDIEKPYTLLSANEETAAFQSSPGGWQGFYQMYADSGGIIELSAVGLNADKTVAVVYSGHHCGSLCGGGGFQVLQKKAGKWQPLTWNGGSCMWAS